jgi:heme-binding NEAT domain protein
MEAIATSLKSMNDFILSENETTSDDEIEDTKEVDKEKEEAQKLTNVFEHPLIEQLPVAEHGMIGNMHSTSKIY